MCDRTIRGKSPESAERGVEETRGRAVGPRVPWLVLLVARRVGRAADVNMV